MGKPKIRRSNDNKIMFLVRVFYSNIIPLDVSFLTVGGMVIIRLFVSFLTTVGMR